MGELHTVMVTDAPRGRDRYSEERHGVLQTVCRENGAELVYAGFESEREVVEGSRDAYIILASKAPMSRRVIEHLQETRCIIRTGVGYDTVNVKAATEHGIPVSNTPGCHVADALAEHAIGLMLGAGREMAYCDREMREQNGWGLGKGHPVRAMYGGVFGIVGLGHIGRAVAERARGLDMEVVAHDPYLPRDVFERLGVNPVSFEELLARSDCVSVHTPLTAETHQMFSTAEFEAMKDDAVFVNTARGPIVDVEALVDAIEHGEIFAAGLDNFEREPPVDSPALSCDRILCSPHHGSAAPETDGAKTRILRDEIERVLTGRKPANTVNPEVFKYVDELLNPEIEEWM